MHAHAGSQIRQHYDTPTNHRNKCKQCIQEALLLQTDCATCYVDQNLVNCRHNLYNKSTTNRSNGVTVDRLVVNSHDSSTVV